MRYHASAIAAPQGTAALRAIEQHANLSVRLALRDLRCDQDGSEAARSVDRIEAAIASLEQLTELAGPTVERHSLRGGSYKRLASILCGEPRRIALGRMRAC